MVVSQHGIGCKPRSKAQATVEANAKTSEKRAKAENTLHAVGRTMANLDLAHVLHLVTLATEPFALEHGVVARDR